jgi:hypothetical protein
MIALSGQRFGQPLADHNETPGSVRRPKDALFARGA